MCDTIVVEEIEATEEDEVTVSAPAQATPKAISYLLDLAIKRDLTDLDAVTLGVIDEVKIRPWRVTGDVASLAIKKLLACAKRF